MSQPAPRALPSTTPRSTTEPPRYWTRIPQRDDLVGGVTFVHSNTRLNINAADRAAFVDPVDAELLVGFRALDPTHTFDESYPVWMATMRRRAESNDAIMERLQRVFTQLVDEESLVKLLVDTYLIAAAYGYERLWFVPQLLGEPMFVPAIRHLICSVGEPLMVAESSGLMSLGIRSRFART